MEKFMKKIKKGIKAKTPKGSKDLNSSQAGGAASASGDSWMNSYSKTNDSWIKMYNEAADLANEITRKLSESSSMSKLEKVKETLRRKVIILGTRLDNVEALLLKLPRTYTVTEEELDHRKEMLMKLRSQANDLAATMDMQFITNRNSLLGKEINDTVAGIDDRLEHWKKEYNSSAMLAAEITRMMSANTKSSSETELQRIRIIEKIIVLGVQLVGLESLLSRFPGLDTNAENDHTEINQTENVQTEEDQLSQCKDMLSTLRLQATEMAATMNMLYFTHGTDLEGKEIHPADTMLPIDTGLDAQNILNLQQQVIQEQDDKLDNLGEIITSWGPLTRYLSGEDDLHRNLLDDKDRQVEVANSHLVSNQRRLLVLNPRSRGRCSFSCLLTVFAAMIIFFLTIFISMKYFRPREHLDLQNQQIIGKFFTQNAAV